MSDVQGNPLYGMSGVELSFPFFMYPGDYIQPDPGGQYFGPTKEFRAESFAQIREAIASGELKPE